VSDEIPPFEYQYEKLRRALKDITPPYPYDEVNSFAQAFQLCSEAFRNFDASMISNTDAINWIRSIQWTLNLEGLSDPYHEGLYVRRAASLSDEEKAAFRDALENLVAFFRPKSDEEVLSGERRDREKWPIFRVLLLLVVLALLLVAILYVIREAL